MSYKCEILADSLNPQGDRITTMKVTFPRFILAEFNTHRMFSRNSASSRAIPFKKMVEMVEQNPFIPIAWQKDHKGMQGTEYWGPDEWIDDTSHPVSSKTNIYQLSRVQWLNGRDDAVDNAKRLNNNKVTKQLANRLLEPFMWHTVIVTSGEEGLKNFFDLRCPSYEVSIGAVDREYFKSKKDLLKKYPSIKPENELDWFYINKSQAEIHIQAIAELMWDAYNESTPKELQAGEWHIPFGGNFDIDQIRKIAMKESFNIVNPQLYIIEQDLKIKIATARCARISYETLGDDPKIDYEADLRLHDILAKSGHWSPFEHVARCMTYEEYLHFHVTNLNVDKDRDLDFMYRVDAGWCRNFKGFIQYRSLIDNGN